MTQLRESILFNDFDLVWKNFFDRNSNFLPITQNKMNYPVDIYTTDNGIRFEIASVGLDKSDIEILTEGETLRVKYASDEDKPKNEFIHKGIAKRAFDFAWKISNDLDISKANAEMDKGLLCIDIPYAKERAPKRLTIK
mgnify:FL=1|tara:strand:- start:213 stop:629 length:417 start_codon:yes stop_codon:yes gene_type:complete